MADVQLSDVVEYRVYLDTAPDLDLRLLALYNSGVIARDAIFNEVAESGARKGELIFWRDIDMDAEANYSSDQPNLAVPMKVSQDKMETCKSQLNQGWSAYNLARELSRGTDALQHIRNRTARYWLIQWQARLIAIIRGVLASNVAGNFSPNTTGFAGDMVVDASIADANAATALNKFNADLFSQAVFTMGDRAEMITTMVVHSAVMQTMERNDDIDYIVDSAQGTRIPFYKGRRVIVDDNTPHFLATAGVPANGFKYVSILFGEEMFGFGVGTPTSPAVEVDSNPRSGDGGGQQELWERKTWLIHPFGYNNNAVVATGNAGSQTLADLQDPTNWTRVIPRKAVKMAFLVTNG